MKNFTLLFALVLTVLASSAQGNEVGNKDKKKEIQETMKLADGLFKMRKYNDISRDLYKQVVISDPNNIKAVYRLAETYRLLKYYSDAQKWYKKVVNMDSEKYPKSKFYYAQMSQAVGNYRLAMGLYYQYMEEIEGEEGYFLDKARLGAESCAFALEQEKVFNHPDSNPSGLARLTKGINKQRSEFGFTRNGKEYLYTGTERIYYKRKIKYPKRLLDSPIKVQYDTISVNRIYSTIKEDNDFSDGVLMDLNMESEFSHVGSPAFSNDSSKMYLTLSQVDHKKGSHFQIYWTEKTEDGSWSALKKVEGKINHKKFASKNPQPLMYGDKEAILFSSNQPGGYGNFDLYVAVLDQEGKATEIINLGESINTMDNEVTPFYNSITNTLFFSSNGHVGFGEMDIYSVKGKPDEGWAMVKNLGLPYNSGADDLYYSQYDEDVKEFLATNRDTDNSIDNSTCCYDIYRPSKDTMTDIDLEKFVMHLNVFDKLTKGELTTINISIIDTKTNNLIESTTSIPGTKLFVHLPGESEWIVRIENEGHEPKDLRVSTLGVSPTDTLRNDVYLRTTLSDEEKAFEDILKKYPNTVYPDLLFRVQIGAFGKSKLHVFKDLKLEAVIEEMQHNNLFKYLNGLEQQASKVESLRQNIVTQGVSDAFVVVYFKGERIRMNEAKYLLSQVGK